MRKNIVDKTIHFYNEKNHEIMYIDYSADECIWFFHSDNVINVTPDMELYNLLDSFMNYCYEFNDGVLLNYKDNNKLIWYSDCYYDPNNYWSIASVSSLNIERKESRFEIWCTKKLDELIDRPSKSYGICFSPAGNGKYSKNLNTGFTLQDDFITHIYHPLLNKNKVLKKIN